MTNPTFPILPPNTIVPTNEDLFIPYLNRLYEEIAFAVNSKDPKYYPMAITTTPTNILNVPNFGAFIICVSGADSSLPTLTASLCKSTAGNGGNIAVIGSQVGSGTWAGKALTINATATNFQISHNLAGTTGNFNIRLIGTQG
jgi:hypothetical protein